MRGTQPQRTRTETRAGPPVRSVGVIEGEWGFDSLGSALVLCACVQLQGPIYVQPVLNQMCIPSLTQHTHTCI